MYELRIHQYKSSAYHQRVKEPLNDSTKLLKTSLKHFVTKQVKTVMKEFIFYCLLLETVQESFGFSPFELVFGHYVRGPLTPYKEKLLSEDDSSLNILS